MDALDDPQVYKVVCMKSAQIGWTDGVINNYVGRRIDIDPCPMVVMFAKEAAAKEYMQEKFEPMVEATPRLSERVDVTRSRKADNRRTFKNFSGGFLKLVGSNSPTNVKSTPAPVVIVEEPDDCAQNVGDQGDAIKLLEERTKTYSRRKVVFGGTPSVKGVSTIEDAYNNSDQRKFYVPCHECGEAHVLDWDHVVWDEPDDGVVHLVYGRARPETARYACPHCGALWTDEDRRRNVRRGEWRAHAEFRGVAGFYLNELYSPFPGSSLARLVERYLEARQSQQRGDPTDMIVFVNSALGLPYEYESDVPEAEELAERAEPYEPMTVPSGGLVLTAGVDVQHDRLAVIIRAWGRDEESWLVHWCELYARNSCADRGDPVWGELDALLFQPFRHATGAALQISAISIDASDGQTSDAVYAWVRAKSGRGVMAVKGASETGAGADREIFSLPRKLDTNNRNTKAARHGLRVYLVGTHRAKDAIAARLRLDGHGPGRMHWHEGVRADYLEQLTAEVKVPQRRGRDLWQKRAGARNEALDCEVYALHAARSLKLHAWKPARWDQLEQALQQADLFQQPDSPEPATASKPARRPRRRGGYVSRWRG